MFEEAGRYDAIYGAASDMYFNLKMANLYGIVLLKKDFFFYRIHEGQELNNRYSYICNNYRYLKDAFQLPGFPLKKEQKKFLLQKAEYYYVKDFLLYLLATKKLKKAIKALSESGMNAYRIGRGIMNLILVKCGMNKFKSINY
jgi:hypothetical protein